MKNSLRIFIAFALAIATGNAQVIKPAMPRDGAGLSESAQATFRANVGAASIAELEQRERSGYLVSDGVTTNRAAGIWRFGADGDVAGYAITIPFEFDVPTSNPTTNFVLAAFSPSASADPTSTDKSHSIYINTSGALVIEAYVDALENRYRRRTLSGWRATHAGQHVRGVVVFEGGSSAAPLVVVNGVDITDAFTESSSLNPNWFDVVGLETTYYLIGYNAPLGTRIWPHAPIVGAVSVNDAIKWTRGGDWPSWCHSPGRGGGNILAGWDFTVGWTEVGSSTITGANTFTSTDVGGPVLAALTPGRYYIVKVEGSAPSGFTIRSGTSGPELFTIGGFGTHLFRATSSLLYLRNSSAGSTTITSLELYEIGSLAEPIVQPILALDDRLNRHGGLVRGFSPVTFGDSRWRIIGNTSTSGNEQILGGAVFNSASNHAIETIEQCTAGTPTTTIGSASGGAQYKASGALSAGTNAVSLVTRVPDGASFWVGSNSTSAVRTFITGHRVAQP